MSTEAAYQAQAESPLTVDRDLYGRFAETDGRTLVDSFEIPIRSGRAWEVPAGHVVRLRTVGGPQVGDLNIWNRLTPASASGPHAPDSSTPHTSLNSIDSGQPCRSCGLSQRSSPTR
jgi:uncharacterized protein YcgI (DUF1989 family)